MAFAFINNIGDCKEFQSENQHNQAWETVTVGGRQRPLTFDNDHRIGLRDKLRGILVSALHRGNIVLLMQNLTRRGTPAEIRRALPSELVDRTGLKAVAPDVQRLIVNTITPRIERRVNALIPDDCSYRALHNIMARLDLLGVGNREDDFLVHGMYSGLPVVCTPNLQDTMNEVSHGDNTAVAYESPPGVSLTFCNGRSVPSVRNMRQWSAVPMMDMSGLQSVLTSKLLKLRDPTHYRALLGCLCMAKQTQGEFSGLDNRPLYVVTSTTLPTRDMPFMAGDAWLCHAPAAISLERADTALALAVGLPTATIHYVVWDRIPDSGISDRCSPLFEISKAALGNVYVPAMYANMHNCYTALTRNRDAPSSLEPCAISGLRMYALYSTLARCSSENVSLFRRNVARWHRQRVQHGNQSALSTLCSLDPEGTAEVLRLFQGAQAEMLGARALPTVKPGFDAVSRPQHDYSALVSLLSNSQVSGTQIELMRQFMNGQYSLSGLRF